MVSLTPKQTNQNEQKLPFEILAELGKLNYAFRINLCKSYIFAALNGTVPQTMANSSTPKLHKSTVNPRYP